MKDSKVMWRSTRIPRADLPGADYGLWGSLQIVPELTQNYRALDGEYVAPVKEMQVRAEARGRVDQ